MRRLIGLLMVAFALTLSVSPNALADTPLSTDTTANRSTFRVEAAKQRAAAAKERADKSRSSESGKASTKTAWNQRKANEETYAQIKARLAKIGATTGGTWNSCNTARLYCPAVPTLVLPDAPDLPPATPADDTAPPPIPAEVVAYAAVAQLTLTAPKPVIGPPPSINRWKMAAVGYPLWLSVDGETDPAPVSTSAFDITVSLDARLTKVVFDMGDGQRVTCTDPTRAWHRGVRPGTESPTCGYRYSEPSLPRGDYTVTARSYWTVDWATPDQTGSIDLAQAATTRLPVGELQVLVR